MKVHVVFIFLPKILHTGGQIYTLKLVKVGNDMMSDTTNGPSNWEFVSMGPIVKHVYINVFSIHVFLSNITSLNIPHKGRWAHFNVKLHFLPTAFSQPSTDMKSCNVIIMARIDWTWALLFTMNIDRYDHFYFKREASIIS